MNRREFRRACPACNGDLVATSTGAVCMNATLGKCDRSRVMPYRVAGNSNQHTYLEGGEPVEFPEASWSKVLRRWICESAAWKRDTSRRTVDAWRDGAKVARARYGGRLLVLCEAIDLEGVFEEIRENREGDQ